MTRRLSACALAVLATAALLAAGCGDDEDDNGGPTTTATTEQAALLPEDIPPRGAAPNIKGADAPMAEVAQKFGTDAIEFFKAVFEQNQKPYREPAIMPADSATTNGCGGPFDPEKDAYFLCLSDQGDRITLGVPYLAKVRDQYGDSGAVFLVGYGVALSAYDQLTGDRLAKGATVDQQFIESAVCLVGAWNRWMTRDKLLEPGDQEELLKITADFIPGQTPEGVSLGQDVYAGGFSKGSRGCTEPEGS